MRRAASSLARSWGGCGRPWGVSCRMAHGAPLFNVRRPASSVEGLLTRLQLSAAGQEHVHISVSSSVARSMPQPAGKSRRGPQCPDSLFSL